jgi:hypothetical protein
MTVLPFNNRLLIEKIEEKENKIGDLFVPDFVKDRKDIPKFMRVKVKAQSYELNKITDLTDKEIIIETGFLEEVVIDNKMYMFCPYNYVVCCIT